MAQQRPSRLDDLHLPADGLVLAARLPPVPPPPSHSSRAGLMGVTSTRPARVGLACGMDFALAR
jgi:hypothetical protein